MFIPDLQLGLHDTRQAHMWTFLLIYHVDVLMVCAFSAANFKRTVTHLSVQQALALLCSVLGLGTQVLVSITDMNRETADLYLEFILYRFAGILFSFENHTFHSVFSSDVISER